ncbi:putative RNA-directed DNA polymerase, eukaryota, reverse transcriptase zinc-binding domain protein [Tanacetum coccineum]
MEKDVEARTSTYELVHRVAGLVVVECPDVDLIKTGIRALDDFFCASVPSNAHDSQHQLGFGLKWRAWINGCLHNARSSVLVNGSPTEEFEVFRGLRQGDPMSPFLFILAMEGLYALTSKAEALGLFKGASIGKDNMSISQLMYVDDVIFFGEWSWINAHNLINEEKTLTWLMGDRMSAEVVKRDGGLGSCSIYGLNIGLIVQVDLSLKRSTWGSILSSINSLKSKGANMILAQWSLDVVKRIFLASVVSGSTLTILVNGK